MIYRVCFYDRSGKLLCWYSTPNKVNAEKMANTKYNTVTVETIYE